MLCYSIRLYILYSVLIVSIESALNSISCLTLLAACLPPATQSMVPYPMICYYYWLFTAAACCVCWIGWTRCSVAFFYVDGIYQRDSSQSSFSLQRLHSMMGIILYDDTTRRRRPVVLIYSDAIFVFFLSKCAQQIYQQQQQHQSMVADVCVCIKQHEKKS